MSHTRPTFSLEILIAKDFFISIDIICNMRHLVLNAQILKINAKENIISSRRNKSSRARKQQTEVQKLKVERLQSSISIHVCVLFSALKSGFLLRKTTTSDPGNIPSILSNDEILSLWTTLVVKVAINLTKKARNKFTLSKTFDKHFCIQFVYVVKDIREFVISDLSTGARYTIQMIIVPCWLFIKFLAFWWSK